MRCSPTFKARLINNSITSASAGPIQANGVYGNPIALAAATRGEWGRSSLMRESSRIPGVSQHKLGLLEQLLREQGISATAKPVIGRRPNQAGFPLSFAQRRLWFLDQLEPGPHYNDHFHLRLQGQLHVPALQSSLNEIVRRHEALRATFTVWQGEPVQSVCVPFNLDLPLADLSSYSEAERKRHATRLAVEAARAPFDLQRGPLLRAGLVRLSAQDHLLVLTFHHIAIDGWSRGVFLRELTVLYQAFLSGQPSPLPELPVQYADFAVWQRERVEEEVLAKELGYWKR